MARSLQGRIVLITGASSGIGRASAIRFAAAGARVVAVGRSAERLDALRREVPEAAGLLVRPCDVLDGPACEGTMLGVIDDPGVPDVVVANAGIGLDARFEHTSDDDVRAVFDTNVLGVYRTVRPFLPGMIARGSGRILLVSSIVGKRGIPNYSAYSGSKFALHGIAGALRTELLGSGVSVGLVCPSSTTTGFHERVRRRGPAQHRVRVATHTPESVAEAIVTMAGNDRREIVLSLEAKVMALVEKFAPGVLDRILHRALVRRSGDG